MRESLFLRGHLRTLGVFWGAAVLFGISLALMVLEQRQYRYAQEQWRAVLAEEEKVRRLETFAASLAQIDPMLFTLTPPREAVIQEKIALEPFDAFVAKLSHIYTDQGFLFVESFELKTCEEDSRTAPSNTAAECRPYAEVRGRKVYFQP